MSQRLFTKQQAAEMFADKLFEHIGDCNFLDVHKLNDGWWQNGAEISEFYDPHAIEHAVASLMEDLNETPRTFGKLPQWMNSINVVKHGISVRCTEYGHRKLYFDILYQ